MVIIASVSVPSVQQANPDTSKVPRSNIIAILVILIVYLLPKSAWLGGLSGHFHERL